MACATFLRVGPLLLVSAPPLQLLLARTRRLILLAAPLLPASVATSLRLTPSYRVGCGLTPRASGCGIFTFGSPSLGLSDRPPPDVLRACPMVPPARLAPWCLVSVEPYASLLLASLTSPSAPCFPCPERIRRELLQASPLQRRACSHCTMARFFR